MAKEALNVLVFDLGGGTFDVSILTFEDGIFEVKSTTGDTHLGGEDIDSTLVAHFLNEFKEKHSKDLSTNKTALMAMKAESERVKRHLSAANQAVFTMANLDDGANFRSVLPRAVFEKLNEDLFNGILGPVKQALLDAHMDKSRIHEVVLIGGSTRIPKIQQLLEHFFEGKKLNKSMNPDEAVAYGAAVQAALLQKNECDVLKDVIISDVTPLSLGVEVSGGSMGIIIRRNTPIPAFHVKDFTTPFDNATSVDIRVFEGERAMIADNHFLGQFKLEGLSLAPQGIPQIEVTFEVDENGILNVSAEEKLSGAQNKITITNENGRLSKEELEKMVSEAEQYKAEDAKQKGIISAKNTLINHCLQMQSNASEEDRKTVNEKCKEILDWLNDTEFVDMEDIKRKQKELDLLIGAPEGRGRLHPLSLDEDEQPPLSRRRLGNVTPLDEEDTAEIDFGPEEVADEVIEI